MTKDAAGLGGELTDGELIGEEDSSEWFDDEASDEPATVVLPAWIFVSIRR